MNIPASVRVRMAWRSLTQVPRTAEASQMIPATVCQTEPRRKVDRTSYCADFISTMIILYLKLEQSPDHMEDDIRPEVDSRRGDQSIFHVAFAHNESDDSVQEKDLYQQNGTNVGQG